MKLVIPDKNKTWRYICVECCNYKNEPLIGIDACLDESSDFSYLCKECIDKMHTLIHQPTQDQECK